MAQGQMSKITNVKTATGTLTSDTGDYIIDNVLPTGAKVLCGHYYTSYNQWRPLSVGQTAATENIIIQSATSAMSGRPYRVFYIV